MNRFSPNPNLAHLIPWFESEAEALQAARAGDKPIMLFLSAFWCRYCQRMDEGALSDRENLALLNAYFISLRAENAMRPDIDARYNLNGWPTIAFFTPGGELLAAANFLSSEDFQELLLNVYLAYQQKTATERLARAEAATESVLANSARNYQQMLTEITDSIMALADRQHGGYGRGQKFIQADANEFLLARYEVTKEPAYLEHVRLTLDRMRASPMHDTEAGGYFRTTTGADWSQPHREKLLVEQAGLLANCLRVHRLNGLPEYAEMAEEIIGYLDGKLFDAATETFFGCEDWLRYEPPAVGGEEFFTIIDHCVYTDANALAVCAYLDAAVLLDKPQCRERERARATLDFLWQRCRSDSGGMFHYFDGEAHVPGLLQDQVQMGLALLRTYQVTGDAQYAERARWLAEFILIEMKNSAGGFYDIRAHNSALLKLRLTLIEQNGAAASFFLALAEATGEEKYRDAARWAFQYFTGNFQEYGIHAASFGCALQEYLLHRTASRRHK